MGRKRDQSRHCKDSLQGLTDQQLESKILELTVLERGEYVQELRRRQAYHVHKHLVGC